MISTGIIIGLALTAVVFLALYLKAKKETKVQALDIVKRIQEERSAAIASSRNTVRGQVNEEMLPLFPDFPYSLSDCKFVSAPIDYVVYKGMSKTRDSHEGDIEIILAEVKMNNAKLSHVQKKILEAVKSGRVKFETWRIKDNKMTIN